MKSGTEIMLTAQADEAKAAYLELLDAAGAICGLLYQSGTYADDPRRLRLLAAVRRCRSWHSTLPQPEKL